MSHTMRPAQGPLSANSILLYLLCIWYTTPWVAYASSSQVAVALAILWATTADWSALGKVIARNLWLGVWAAYLLILAIFGAWQYGQMELAIFALGVTLFVLPALLTDYYRCIDSRSTVRAALLVSVAGYLVGYAMSVNGLSQNPLASRLLATTDIDRFEFTAIGIGGFGYVMAAGFVTIASLHLILRRRALKRLARLLILLTLPAGIIFMVISQYTIAPILAILAATLLLLGNAPRALRFLLATVFMVVTFSAAGLLANAIDALASLLSMDWYSTHRLRELAGAMQGFGVGSETDLAIRRDLADRSLRALTEAPWFGRTLDPTTTTIGGHNGWLDLLATYGIIGTIPLLAFLFSYARRRLADAAKEDWKALFWATALLFTAFGVVNPFVYVYDLGFAALFFVPAAGMTVAPDRGLGLAPTPKLTTFTPAARALR